MSDNRFPVKGFREGLLVSIGEGDWKDVSMHLISQIDERVDFYKGAKLAIDVNERLIRAAELGELRDLLSERKITLFAVLGKSNGTQAVAESLGLSTTKSVLQDQQNNKVNQALVDGESAILIRKTMRSGVSIKFPGHVIIEGDINPGAEIIASGSIYVWGKLRGSAHAGVNGDEGAVVCALEFSPLNLRIANLLIRDSKIKIKKKKFYYKAFIKDGTIRIEEWNS